MHAFMEMNLGHLALPLQGVIKEGDREKEDENISLCLTPVVTCGVAMGNSERPSA